ncbi:MAG: hypothetical protein P1U74_06320 [Legionellaceae bacterium]|nr:hypothetical protein [Legionellaceae bacterium]
MCWFQIAWLKNLKIKRLQKQLLNMQQSRLQNQASGEMLSRELQTYRRLANVYEKLKGCVKFPFAREQAIACYRAAAALDDVEAQFTIGQKLLEEGKMRDKLQQNTLFSSVSNELFMNELYKEAHAFLLSAEKQQHINAKRIRGLCYINGWGVAVDKDVGFDLVVESIEQENSWDRVQKIFKELGINQSSFFSELFQHRK